MRKKSKAKEIPNKTENSKRAKTDEKQNSHMIANHEKNKKNRNVNIFSFHL